MAQTFPRPALAQPRAVQTLEMVRTVTGGGNFDPDVWHVMNERDNSLIADEILHGHGSSAFVYDFEIGGTRVSGVSVIGARHLAAHYRGLKHRLVASMQKTGELFVAQSFPGENTPMAVSATTVPELGNEPDFYSALVEMQDVKTGNSIQIERREARFEQRRNGVPFERLHYQTIAQSKAYRNAVLSLIPQDIVIRWKAEMLKLGKGEAITSSVIDEKRSGVLRFATQHGLAFDRRAIEHLTLEQIGGLGDAARQGQVPAFVNAAHALGLDVAVGEEAAQETGRAAPDVTQPPAAAGTAGPSQAARRGRPPGPRRQEEPPPVEDERAFGEPEPQQEEPPPVPRRQVDFDV